MKKFFSVLASVAVLFMSCSEKSDVGQNAGGDAVIPELPADPQPGSTDFSHRILLLQHTGTACPNCPQLMASLKTLTEDDSYTEKYQHVAAHSYNQSDPAYSKAAENLSQAFCSGYYPELTFNLTKENTGTSLAVDVIKSHIDNLHQDSADAGIAASVNQTGSNLGVNVQIKAAKENKYRIAVWVLEDGIRARQDGAFEDWMNTHSNAVRVMAGSTLNLRIYGENVDVLKKGETAGKSFVIGLEDGWNAENCKVLVLLNAATDDGRYNLVNCAICPIGESVAYKYN
ncbi:MAG: Omp28-related outer membrane protein [Bacteroidales bacterium]|nr:Omp28-related outer membrane protein [Bacteroidales bacterium]